MAPALLRHLEAAMLARHLDGWLPDDTRLLFVENVGNLVCPASYDLGEGLRVALASNSSHGHCEGHLQRLNLLDRFSFLACREDVASPKPEPDLYRLVVNQLVRLEDRFRERTPELVWTLTADDFAALAALAFAPKEIPTVGLEHLHAPLVSIREQAAQVVALLRGGGPVTFRQLIAGVEQRGVVVARFLAVLELLRHAAISFEQLEPLGDLTLTWTAAQWSDENLAALGADYDA